MLNRCSECGRPISARWLILGLPWSRYTCPRCGSVFEGTVLRFTLTSVSVGVLGVVLIGALKGRLSPALLLPLLLITAALFMLRLPGQIRRAGS